MTSPIYGVWWCYLDDADRRPDHEFTFMWGDTGDDPDWSIIEEQVGPWYPHLMHAQRFTPDEGGLVHSERRSAWIGGSLHEWDDDDICELCEARRAEAEVWPAPYDDRCPSQVVLEDLRGVGRQSTSIGAAIESGQLEALIVMGPIP